ncbi:hypothetical protein GCM10029976_090840 [Kribbella albertanoniae]|uniref:Uncharacterized protein n=1 Tax=Kribbella albertanoniae TaxID=1266829 RepID=A0A4R4PJM7_9ACTN|nr:hypothetical protein [Kribbella albertanoniae]TDC22154.1 hypothetical protein E1261_31690 [Kribbella albertanoniae]
MSDPDFDVVGYNPDDVIGYGETEASEAADSDLASAVPRPLEGIEYIANLEADAAAELDAVQQGFRDRKEREAERMELATNSDYWLCVCFATQAQRDAFLAATNWRDLGTRYLDGREIARRQGIELPPDPVWPNARRDTTWDSYAMTVEENQSIN